MALLGLNKPAWFSPDAIVRRYGESIALEGDTLVIGDEGAVHVFGRNRKTNTWSHTQG